MKQRLQSFHPIAGAPAPYVQVMSAQVRRNLEKYAASTKLQRAFMHLAVQILEVTGKGHILHYLVTTDEGNWDDQMTGPQLKKVLSRDRSLNETRHVHKTVEVCMALASLF